MIFKNNNLDKLRIVLPLTKLSSTKIMILFFINDLSKILKFLQYSNVLVLNL